MQPSHHVVQLSNDLSILDGAQWICLHLPSCHPRSESQSHHLCFYNLYYLCYICNEKRTKNKQKEAGFGTFFFKRILDAIISMISPGNKLSNVDYLWSKSLQMIRMTYLHIGMFLSDPPTKCKTLPIHWPM